MCGVKSSFNHHEVSKVNNTKSDLEAHERVLKSHGVKGEDHSTRDDSHTRVNTHDVVQTLFEIESLDHIV